MEYHKDYTTWSELGKVDIIFKDLHVDLKIDILNSTLSLNQLKLEAR